jgi:hypothetical protein
MGDRTLRNLLTKIELWWAIKRKKWMNHIVSSDEIHTIPMGDTITHTVNIEIDGIIHEFDCICGPEVNPVKRGDGSMGWVYLHNAADGRK